mgnify:CR=1 FL=1
MKLLFFLGKRKVPLESKEKPRYHYVIPVPGAADRKRLLKEKTWGTDRVSTLSRRSRSEAGQASFEFILVLTFVLAVLIALVVPLGTNAQHALDDVFRASSLASNVRQLNSAVNLAELQGGDSVQWLSLYLPADTNVECHIASGANDSDRIVFQVQFHKRVFDASGAEPGQCYSSGTQMTCVKSVVIPSSLDFKCQGAGQSFILESGESGFAQNVQVRYFSISPARIDFSTR